MLRRDIAQAIEDREIHKVWAAAHVPTCKGNRVARALRSVRSLLSCRPCQRAQEDLDRQSEEMDEMMKSSSRYGAASADESFLHCSEELARIGQEQRLVRGVTQLQRMSFAKLSYV